MGEDVCEFSFSLSSPPISYSLSFMKRWIPGFPGMYKYIPHKIHL